MPTSQSRAAATIIAAQGDNPGFGATQRERTAEPWQDSSRKRVLETTPPRWGTPP